MTNKDGKLNDKTTSWVIKVLCHYELLALLASCRDFYTIHQKDIPSTNVLMTVMESAVWRITPKFPIGVELGRDLVTRKASILILKSFSEPLCPADGGGVNQSGAKPTQQNK